VRLRSQSSAIRVRHTFILAATPQYTVVTDTATPMTKPTDSRTLSIPLPLTRLIDCPRATSSGPLLSRLRTVCAQSVGTRQRRAGTAARCPVQCAVRRHSNETSAYERSRPDSARTQARPWRRSRETLRARRSLHPASCHRVHVTTAVNIPRPAAFSSEEISRSMYQSL
jgi:hypothetical protein